MIKSCRVLLMALLMSLFWAATATAQKERDFDFDLNSGLDPGDCGLAGVSLSLNTKIYGTGAYNGLELDIQIDNSGHQATLFKAVVNSPNDPVILVLAAYEPSIWHISWTEGTKIAAVVASGYYVQKISGLPKNVPVLSSHYDDKGPCRYFSEIGRADGVAEKLFGRKIDRRFPVLDGRALIGEALAADAELLTDSEFRKEDFHDPDKPLAGEAGLDAAESNGLIRKATGKDIQDYLAAVARGSGLPEHLITDGLRASDGAFHHGYVVLSPDFIIPAGLYGAHSATFILPEGMPQPKGPVAHCNFKSFTEAKEKGRPARPIPKACALPDFQLPPGLKVYAAGSYSGSDLDIQIDDSGHQATLMEVTVNSPRESVALLLGAYEPTIWHLNWTEGTKIAAVIVSGYHTQMLSGLPKEVPVLNSRGRQASQCPSFYVSSDLSALLTINSLANHHFKRDIDRVYQAQNGRAFIGEALAEGVKLVTAEELKKEKFADPDKPLAGEAGLADAEKKGLIRKAGREDLQDYLAAVARNSGLPAHLTGGLKSGGGSFHNGYVVLSRDFVIPAGLYGAHSATFILPLGMPWPKGPEAHCSFKSYADTRPAGTIAGPCGFPNLQLPPGLKVYAAGAYSGSKLDIQIDDSDHPATLMRVTVNSPQEPVALLLGAYEPTIWHLSWTESTKISAVVVSGNYSQRLSGLPEDVPVLNNRANSPNDCPSFYVEPDLNNLLTVNGLANHIFKKDVDRLYSAKDGLVMIGEAWPEGVKLITLEEFKEAKFANPKKPLVGQKGIRQSESAGLLRKAGPEDYEKWLAQYARRQKVAEDKIKEGIKDGSIKFGYPPRNAYVVLSPDFIVPAGLYGGNSSDFIVPEGLPLPQGPRSHAVFYLLKDGTCVGARPGCKD